jgi:hypothetical protein
MVEIIEAEEIVSQPRLPAARELVVLASRSAASEFGLIIKITSFIPPILLVVQATRSHPNHRVLADQRIYIANLSFRV